MLVFLALLLVAALAWVGHAYLLTSALNYLYGRRLPKAVLKPWRHVTGVLILAFPLLLWSAKSPRNFDSSVEFGTANGVWSFAVVQYASLCLAFGAGVFPVITLVRYFRKRPACVVAESTRTLDLWPELGAKLVGDGKHRWAVRVPGNCTSPSTSPTSRFPCRTSRRSGTG